MLDYRLNDDNTLAASHKDLEKIDLSKDIAALDYAEKMANILSSRLGHDGQIVKNIEAAEAGKRGIAAHAKTVQKLLGNDPRAGHNIWGYDNNILKGMGIAGSEDIDTLSMAKDLLKMLNPICPFMTEELWQVIFNEPNSITYAEWPKYDGNTSSLYTALTKIIICEIAVLKFNFS